jgi:hypothetical protein
VGESVSECSLSFVSFYTAFPGIFLSALHPDRRLLRRLDADADGGRARDLPADAAIRSQGVGTTR